MPLVVMIVIYGRIFAVSKRIADAEARAMPVSLSAGTAASGGGGGLGSRSGSTAVFDAASLSGGAGPQQRTDSNRFVLRSDISAVDVFLRTFTPAHRRSQDFLCGGRAGGGG